MISTRAASCRLRVIVSMRDVSLEGLTKQRTLWNPRSRRTLTSLGPMKPAAPVTRIGSAGLIMNVSCVISRRGLHFFEHAEQHQRQSICDRTGQPAERLHQEKQLCMEGVGHDG